MANCAATQERTLAEELFGVESRRGGRKGLIEIAAGGTLVLRGAGEIRTGVRSKIREVIEGGIFRRVGGRTEMRADARWILAAERPRDFGWLASTGECARISVPTLRSRPEDLELLVDSMILKFGEGRVTAIRPDALRLLEAHAFPGNVRELEGVMERACMLADGETLSPEHFQGLNGSLH